jgi:hypothetical protein
MPLTTPLLQSALEALFAEPPPTGGACADAWACAMLDYAAGILPPSATVDAAADTLAAALAAAFATPAAALAVDDAFMAFAVTVGGGMAPAYVATPPPAALGIASLFTAPAPTHVAAAATFGALIDTWLRTGTAQLVAPPFAVLPWT